MRVIAGELRGRVLRSTTTSMLRPTTDRVRESIFNILAARVSFEGARVLDLFAGTGALGIEALSRGAAYCDFVENDRRAVAVIVENIDALDLASRSNAVQRDALKYIAETPERYDLIFADPPYAAPIFDRLLRAIIAHHTLRAGGILTIEHAGAMRIAPPEGARLLLERAFGDTAITIVTAADEPESPGQSAGHPI